MKEIYFSLVCISAFWMTDMAKFCLAKTDYLYFGLTILSGFPLPVLILLELHRGLQKEKGIKFKDVKLCYLNLICVHFMFLK